jgi:hypothetical protein
MATVEAHYQDVLSGIYSWMLGGFDVQLTKNRSFFENHHIRPKGSSIAIDLGAGCGFQSIPLAEMGYSVTAIDLDDNLLRELIANDATGTVTIERDDMINFDSLVTGPSELIVCMTDTLLHLESKARVRDLFNKVIDHLESSGRFVITFRDLSSPLDDLDRFIPVKQDKSTIFTCFLEYEADTVKVHDLVYSKINGQWKFNKSFYRKLRLSPDWVKDRLVQAGFPEVAVDIENGLVTVVAGKARV